MNNTSSTSCTLNNSSNIPSPVNISNVQSPNNSSQLSQQSKMTDSHQSIDEHIQQQRNQHQLHSHHSQQQSVFTIEQIELIRRLRRTNLSISQFIEAYKEMERLEEEMSVKKDLQFDNTASSITYALNNNSSPLSNSQLAVQQLLPGSGHHYPTNTLTNHQYNSLPHQSQQLNNSFQSSDDNIELANFKKKGEQVMLLEIKQFVSKYNVRQSMISEATGISQGYISTFFHGEKMSEKRKNIIYQWYLTYSKNPSKIATDRQQMSLNNSNNSKFNHDFGLENSNSFGTNNDMLFPITRRDRFIFRKQHLKILEDFFSQNPYPEIHIKEQIVEECNTSAENSSGKPLKEADKVTVAIVSNWFNNKRKNARKQQYNNNSTNSNMNSLALSSHSLNSSTGSANLSQSSNPGTYLNNNLQNSPSPVSTNAYLTSIQSHHQQIQPNHQDANSFDQQSNYGYDCNNYNSSGNNTSNNNQGPSSNSNSQMHLHVRNQQSASGQMQFKNEPDYNYLDNNCFSNKLPPNTSSSNSKSDNENDVDLAQDPDESNLSEFSSQSFNGNDSIDN